MQHVKKQLRNLLSVTAVAWMCGSALAQVAPTVPPVQAPTLERDAAKSVRIGKESSSPSAISLKETERLQRELFMAELRAKALAAAPQSGPGSATSTLAQQLQSPPKVKPRPPTVRELNPEPKAQLVNIISMMGRARADVTYQGITETIKEGDRLEGWNVVKIDASGVLVQKRVVTMLPDKTVQRPAGKASKRHPVEMISELTLLSARLTPYSPPADLAAPVVGESSFAPPHVPPLPAGIKFPDSTSIGPATSNALILPPGMSGFTPPPTGMTPELLEKLRSMSSMRPGASSKVN